MYSALHAGGRRLHELARAGIAVERSPRRVRVYAFELIECVAPRLRVRVRCGSGTYVRSLAADVGEALGCGGHVEALVRTRVGSLRLEDAVPWAAIQEGDAAALAAGVLPPDRAVGHLPAVHVSADVRPPARPRPARAAVRAPRRRRFRRPAPHAACTPARAFSASARYRPTGCAPFASSMQIVRGLDQYRPDAPPSVVAQGTFDGIHLGHQAVIRTAVERAQALGVRPVAVTFDPNPLAVLRPADAPPELLTLDERLERIAELGPEVCLVIPFTPEFSLVEAEDYVRDVLLGLLGAREIVVGFNHAFGRGARGTPELLRRLAEPAGVVVHVVPPLRVDGVTVSSTSIREALRDGDVRRAASLLGRPYGIAGVVARGAARGRALGFPTANLAASPGLFLADGVYAARADVGRGLRIGGGQRGSAADRGRRDASRRGAPLRRDPGSLRPAPPARVPRPDPPGAAVRVAGRAPRADRRGRGDGPAVARPTLLIPRGARPRGLARAPSSGRAGCTRSTRVVRCDGSIGWLNVW